MGYFIGFFFLKKRSLINKPLVELFHQVLINWLLHVDFLVLKFKIKAYYNQFFFYFQIKKSNKFMKELDPINF